MTKLLLSRPKGRLLIAAALAAAALAAALIDGGERALRPIAEPVALPSEG